MSIQVSDRTIAVEDRTFRRIAAVIVFCQDDRSAFCTGSLRTELYAAPCALRVQIDMVARAECHGLQFFKALPSCFR